MKACFAILLLLSLLSAKASALCTCQECDDQCYFMPFGLEVGDSQLDHGFSETSDPISITVPFKFFGEVENTLFVNTNGILTFRQRKRFFTPTVLPGLNTPAIMVFYADTNSARGGSVFYRSVTDSENLGLIGGIVTGGYDGAIPDFAPTWGFVATYCSVAQRFTSDMSREDRPRNTYQIIMGTDGDRAFVVYQYGDTEWTAPNARVGFDKGDFMTALDLTPSLDLLNAQLFSNEVVCGSLIHQVDGASITSPGPLNSCAPLLAQDCVNGVFECSALTGSVCVCDCGFSGTFCEQGMPCNMRKNRKDSEKMESSESD